MEDGDEGGAAVLEKAGSEAGLEADFAKFFGSIVPRKLVLWRASSFLQRAVYMSVGVIQGVSWGFFFYSLL